jgi:hypothetical protein
MGEKTVILRLQPYGLSGGIPNNHIHIFISHAREIRCIHTDVQYEYIEGEDRNIENTVNAWMNNLCALKVYYVRFSLLVGSCPGLIFILDLFLFLPANFLGMSFHHSSFSICTFHNSKH